MEVEVIVTPATDADAIELGQNMRSADIEEVLASAGRGPIPVVRESVESSVEAWAVRVGDDLLCVWGVVPYADEGLGVVWMLAAKAIEKHGRAFWLYCKQELPELMTRWDRLFNAIDVRHEKAIRWAEKLGFPLEDPAPFGAHGLDFRFFALSREDLNV